MNISSSSSMERVRDLASKKAAVIFTKSSCCMCHSIKTLFYELGASPAIHELDKDPQGRDMERALFRVFGSNPAVPAVFVGGRFVGSAKDVISFHVDGSLKQMLKDSKAIWL
ncbi:Thioredoxin-like superfamily [Arabidopsis suecica]|uniref:Thioredoxin-like superfamily n=3 Tax=Arabidopsis TaxID=3701 RepID=A0A8T1XJQ9_ARASU|nr:Thioredoxin-like superfamily [Arabidopsis suecica]